MTKSSATLAFKRTIKVILIHVIIWKQRLWRKATVIGKTLFKTTAVSNCMKVLAVKLHESSSCHRVFVETVYTLPRTTNDIADLLSKKHAAEEEIAKKALLKILSNARFLARQALPFQGPVFRRLHRPCLRK